MRQQVLYRQMRPAPSLFRHSLARQAFRQRYAAPSRRFASTETSQQDALAAVQKTLGRVWEGAQKFLGPVGEKAGNLLGGELFVSFVLLAN
jgi:F-type H+-transporting ATPase subunit g